MPWQTYGLRPGRTASHSPETGDVYAQYGTTATALHSRIRSSSLLPPLSTATLYATCNAGRQAAPSTGYGNPPSPHRRHQPHELPTFPRTRTILVRWRSPGRSPEHSSRSTYPAACACRVRGSKPQTTCRPQVASAHGPPVFLASRLTRRSRVVELLTRRPTERYSDFPPWWPLRAPADETGRHPAA